jgi:hypothetical protein
MKSTNFELVRSCVRSGMVGWLSGGDHSKFQETKSLDGSLRNGNWATVIAKPAMAKRLNQLLH